MKAKHLIYLTLTFAFMPKTYSQEQVPIESVKEILKNQYANESVFIGTTLGREQLGTGIEKLFLKDFTYATSRNFGKETYIHPKPEVWKWDKLEEFIKFGTKHKIALRIHGPISPQASKWAKADHRTAKDLEKNMTEFMTALSKKLNKAKAVKWMDVVNETIERNGDWFKDKPGVKEWENPWVKMGYDKNGVPLYITKAFKITNKCAPNVSQVFNQHGGMEPVMWEKVKKTILYLRKQGYRVDGLGWQAHLKAHSRVVDDPKNLEYLSNLIDWAHANKLDFHITEFDYHLKTGDNTLENYKIQAEAYATILKIVLEKRKSGVVTFNVWGFTDGADGKNAHRFLYDENLKPKPAYFAIKNTLKKVVNK
jgi:GH35 family endo-1,4-beta-xylanase